MPSACCAKIMQHRVFPVLLLACYRSYSSILYRHFTLLSRLRPDCGDLSYSGIRRKTVACRLVSSAREGELGFLTQFLFAVGITGGEVDRIQPLHLRGACQQTGLMRGKMAF